jgi:hypothetical protein
LALVVIHTRTFGIEIDKNVVRGVLSKHYREPPHGTGPSWLTFIGHTKDSLWSVDLFRCESTLLQSFWVLVVMDQFTPRIVGFGIQRGAVDGPALGTVKLTKIGAIWSHISLAVVQTINVLEYEVPTIFRLKFSNLTVP